MFHWLLPLSCPGDVNDLFHFMNCRERGESAKQCPSPPIVSCLPIPAAAAWADADSPHEKDAHLPRIIFITGTDTGVGKTVLTGLFLHHLREGGCHALALKPFCSGSRADNEFGGPEARSKKVEKKSCANTGLRYSPPCVLCESEILAVEKISEKSF